VAEDWLSWLGGELRPIPLSAVEFQQREGDVRAVLSIPEQQWENAPTVEREQIASLSQESRAREIYSFYGEDYQQRQQQQRQFGAPPRSGQSQDETIDQLLQQHRERQQQQQQQSSSSPSQESQSSATSSPSSGTSQSSQQEFGAPNRESSSSSGQSSSGQSSSSPSESSATSGGEQQSSQQEFGAATEQRSSQSAQMSQSQQAQTQQSQSQQQQQVQLASDLMDKEVTNSQQQKLGKISDLLIDTQQGRIAFVLLEPDSAFWQSPEETFAVAPQSLQTVSDRQAVLNITQHDLEQAQMLNESNIEQHIQQAAASTSGQRRVFRYQESGESGSRGVFGSPDRSSESSRDAGQSDSSSGTNY